ncbi:uncharacterized protein im:7136021 [Xyrauchen texanus]|uniref:uncharacterized protein im:7136021 n=1 Tax=Xyrauchen texanus TaxID=154827 RepID=UPI002242B1FD|nr:uncharacterized protein im:7136021 [Xyrauchen texanus]
MAVIQLPEEIWMDVFGFLSSRDKLSVRSSCKAFKRLIDHWSLWKNNVVVLKKIGAYDAHFWRTLGKRKTKSIVMQKATVNELQKLVTWLPWICSVTLVLCCDATALAKLGSLKHLRRLVIRQCRCTRLANSLLSLKRLTHLCLCEVERASISEISVAISQLVDLTTLYYHEDKNPIPKTVLHGMLRCLPNLKHLSLRMGPKYGILPDDYFCLRKECRSQEMGAEVSLTSLELLNYEDPCLSTAAFSGLSSLTKLTVHYKGWLVDPNLCCLTDWLLELPLLSELNVSLGYPLSVYAKSIPRTVQYLSLMGVKAELNAVRIMGEQVPDLLHLHLDLCCHDSCDIIKEMPQIFPKLQTLKVRHHDVPASLFLGLQDLPRLKQLVILDATQSPSPTVLNLTQELNVQTNNRIRVLHSSGPKDQTTCTCGF